MIPASSYLRAGPDNDFSEASTTVECGLFTAVLVVSLNRNDPWHINLAPSPGI